MLLAFFKFSKVILLLFWAQKLFNFLSQRPQNVTSEFPKRPLAYLIDAAFHTIEFVMCVANIERLNGHFSWEYKKTFHQNGTKITCISVKGKNNYLQF